MLRVRPFVAKAGNYLACRMVCLGSRCYRFISKNFATTFLKNSTPTVVFKRPWAPTVVEKAVARGAMCPALVVTSMEVLK
jgi:hypothetical protein